MNRRARILATTPWNICPSCGGLVSDRSCDCCDRTMVYREAVYAWRSVAWGLSYSVLAQTNALRALDGLPQLPREDYDFTVPWRHEMHAAGWMPSSWGGVHCPAMGVCEKGLPHVSADPAKPGALLVAHFAIMGEPMPEGECPALHVLDTPTSRTLARKAGVPSPSAESIWSEWR